MSLASRSVICYAEPRKQKSRDVMGAFAVGCGGKVGSTEARGLEPGDCAFYGVRPGWLHLWEQAKRENRTWWYCDNSYFDVSREKYFRISRCSLQADEQQAVGSSQGAARLKALGVTIHGWCGNGKQIVVCPQTNEFLQIVAGYKGEWLDDTIATLRKHTDRPVRIRKKGSARPLAEDLRGAWALVTHMSCAAVEALVAGIPVFCTGRCAAWSMGLEVLSLIETPHYPERRQEWAESLAANQWTLDEIRSGAAWRFLTQ